MESWGTSRLGRQLPYEAAVRYFGLRWSEERIRAARGRVVERTVESLAHHLGWAYWPRDGRAFELAPAEVLSKREAFAKRWASIGAADLRWPLRIAHLGGTEVVLDGLHRLAKALAEGEQTVRCVEVVPSHVSRTVAVIPARLGSTRLPGKALAELGGLPLVCHVWRRVAGSGLFARVVVATDDADIEAAVRDDGGEVVRTGPALSGTHRIAEAIRHIHEGELVVNVQGDQPLVPVRALSAAVWSLHTASIGTVAAPYLGDPDDPALVKVTVRDGKAVDFTRRATPRALHHVGIYAFERSALERAVVADRTERTLAEDLEQLAWLDAGLVMAVETITSAPQAIDTPDQLQALQRRFELGLESVPDRPDPGVYAAAGLRYPAPVRGTKTERGD